MSPADPQSAFVDNYIKLMTDSETSDFQKILDMKVGNSTSVGLIIRNHYRYQQISTIFLIGKINLNCQFYLTDISHPIIYKISNYFSIFDCKSLLFNPKMAQLLVVVLNSVWFCEQYCTTFLKLVLDRY